MKPQAVSPRWPGWGAAVAGIVGLLTVGCSGPSEPGRPRAPGSGESPEVIRAVDGRDNMVQLAQPAQRVVSLAPSCTEIVAAVGGVGQLVAVTPFCDRPAAVQQLPKVAGFNDTSLEALLGLQPDLVLASDITTPAMVRRLRQAGLTVAVLTGAGLDGIAADTTLVGRLLGREAAAAAVVADFQHRRTLVAQRVEERDRHRLGSPTTAGEDGQRRPSATHRPRVVLFFGRGTTFSAGRDTFIDGLLREAGGENLAAEAPSPWPQLSREFLLQAGPEVLFITTDGVSGIQRASGETLDFLKRDPFWSRLDAVQSGAVWEVDSSRVSVPSPAVIIVLEGLAAALSGEGN